MEKSDIPNKKSGKGSIIIIVLFRLQEFLIILKDKLSKLTSISVLPVICILLTTVNISITVTCMEPC